MIIVYFLLQFQGSNDVNQGVQTLAEIAAGQEHERVAQISTVNVDLGGEGGPQAVSLAEATIGPDGQIILTDQDGTQSSMLTLDSRILINFSNTRRPTFSLF